MYTNYPSSQEPPDRNDQQQSQQRRSGINRHNSEDSTGGALFDSYFLPGGILDPDEVASSQQQHQQQQQQQLFQPQSQPQHSHHHPHQQLHLYPGSESLQRHRTLSNSNSLRSSATGGGGSGGNGGIVGGGSLEIHGPTAAATTSNNNNNSAAVNVGVGVSALDPSQDNFIEGDPIFYSGSNLHSSQLPQQQQHRQQLQHFSTLSELNTQSFTQTQQSDLFRNSNRSSINSVTKIVTPSNNHEMTTIGGNWLASSPHDQQQQQQQQQQHLRRGSLSNNVTLPLPQAVATQPMNNNKNPWGNNNSSNINHTATATTSTLNDPNTDLLMNMNNHLKQQKQQSSILHSRVGNNNNDVSFLFNNHNSRGSLATSSTSNKSLLSSNHNPQSIATQPHRHVGHTKSSSSNNNTQQQQITHQKNSSPTIQHKTTTAATTTTTTTSSFQRPPPGFNSSMVSAHNSLEHSHKLQQQHQQQSQTQQPAQLPHHLHYQTDENVGSDANLMQQASVSGLHNTSNTNSSLNQRHVGPQQRHQQQQSMYQNGQQQQQQQQKTMRENVRGRNLEEQQQRQQSLHRVSQQQHARQHLPYTKSKHQNTTFVQNHQHPHANQHKFDEDYDLASLNSKTSRDVPSTIYVPEEDAISNSEDTLTICADSITETSLTNNLINKKGENGKTGGGSGEPGGNNERKMSVLEEASQSVNEKRSKSKRQKKKRNKKRNQNKNSMEAPHDDNGSEKIVDVDHMKQIGQGHDEKGSEDYKGENLKDSPIPDLSSSTGEGGKHDYSNRASWTAATSSSSKATTVHRRPGKKAHNNKNQYHQHQQRDEKGSRTDNYNGNKKNSSKQRNEPPKEPVWDQIVEKLRALRPIVIDCAHIIADYSSSLTTKLLKWIASFCPQRERFWFFVPLFCITLDMSFLAASMITALIGKLMYICLLMHKLAFLEMLEFDSASLCYTLICLYPIIVTFAKESFTFEEYWTVFIRWFAVDRLLCRPIRMKDTFLNRIKDEERQRLIVNTFGARKAKRKSITMKDVARLIIKFRSKEDAEETERVTMANHILLILRKITPLVLMIEVNVRRQGFLMSMSKTERILLSYGFAVIRSGYLFSPLIWMSWTLQLTVIMFAPASRFWAYLLMLVGLSAIRLSHYTASIEDLEGIYISYRDDDDYPRKKEKSQGLFS